METYENKYSNQERKVKGVLKRFSFSGIRSFLMTIGAGGLIGLQIYNPNKRIIEAIVGFVLVLMLWNFSTLNSVLFLLVMYPFPFAINIGNSNVIFSFIIFTIFLVRVSTGHEKFRFKSEISIPVLLLVGTYIISFYNVDISSVLFKNAIINSVNFFTAVLFMVMVINLVDNEEKLKRIVRFMVITASLVIAFTFIEMLFPGKTIVPNWLYTHHATRLVMKGMRMGGPFHDFELVAEFFAMHVLIFFFMYVRSRRLATKSIFMSLLIIDLMMMFATITRGAFISLFIGIVYLTILSRKDLNFVRLVSLVGAFTLLIVALEAFVAKYTTAGSLFDRLFTITLERGIIPYNRVAPWGIAIEKAKEHILIGSGAGWDFSKGIGSGMWPHNVYLFYLNITGLVGLSAFLFLLFRLMKTTMTGIRSSIVTSSFAEGFMKVLHVCLVMFCIDQIKIEYLRNEKYVYFIWFLFGLIIATGNVIKKNREKTAEPVPPPEISA